MNWKFDGTITIWNQEIRTWIAYGRCWYVLADVYHACALSSDADGLTLLADIPRAHQNTSPDGLPVVDFVGFCHVAQHSANPLVRFIAGGSLGR